MIYAPNLSLDMCSGMKNYTLQYLDMSTIFKSHVEHI